MGRTSKKIILILPKTLSKHKESADVFRLDYGYWNFYLPLLELGHNVTLFDSSIQGNDDLKVLINKVKPDLLFCVMTGSSYYCKDEPWETIEEETRKGNITTFNWFCDDSWRFDSFSKNVCNFFTYCSTPEKSFVKKYKDIGYSNILYSTWHANKNLYSIDRMKKFPVSFIGRVDSFRKPYIDFLETIGIKTNNPKNVCFEDLVDCYSGSLAGLNFSKNSTGEGTQIKARVFEVVACKAALVTEYCEELENNFILGKEILTFKNNEELKECMIRLSDSSFLEELAKKGYSRFIKQHTSQIRLNSLLQKIK